MKFDLNTTGILHAVCLTEKGQSLCEIESETSAVDLQLLGIIK